MRGPLTLGCMTIVAVLVIAATARAGIVGVDVSGSVYTGPGVLDTSSRTWELKPSTGDTFLLDGQTIAMAYGTNWAGGANAPIDLFDNYKHNNGGAAFGVVLTGLDLSKQYNLAVYGAQNFLGGRGGSFDPAEPDLPAKSTTGDQTSTFAEGVNYVRFDNVTPDNTFGDQRIRFLVGNGPEGIAIFNGFEIESVATGPPPPPPPPPPANTILQYGFDFTTGTVASNGPPINDDSGTGNHGIIIQGHGGTYSADIPTSEVQNATGIGSLSPSSGNYVGTAGDIVTFADIITNGGLTLEAWAKGGGSGPIISIEGVYSLSSTANGGAFVDGFDNNNRRVDGSFDRSQWHHMAGVLSNPYLSGSSMYADMTLYVDGLSAGTLPNQLFNADLNRAAAIGNHPLTGINEPFSGLVYEPRISLGALDPSQFTFGTGTVIPEPSTSLIWGLGMIGLAWYARRRRTK